MAHSRVSEPKQVRGTLMHGGGSESTHNTEGICTKGRPNMGGQGKHEKEAICVEGSLTGCHRPAGGPQAKVLQAGCVAEPPRILVKTRNARPQDSNLRFIKTSGCLHF